MASPAFLLGLAALLPAAANPALLVRGETIDVALCNGGTIGIPLGPALPNPDSHACCNKGCRTGDKRRRAKDRQAAIF